MAFELLQKGVVLKLVICLFLSTFGRCAQAWEIPDDGVIPDNKVTCQNDRLKLNCGNSSMGLIIYSAQFGRTEPGHVICPYNGDKNDQNYNCGEKDVTEKLKTMCAKKSKCKVRVQSALFGNPCRHKAHPYLNLVYACELQKRKKPPLYTSSSTITMAKSTQISTLTTNTLPSTTSIVSFSSITITSTVNIAATRATPSTLLSSREHVTVHTTTTEPNDSRVKAVNTLQVEQVVSTAKSEVGSLGISGTLFVWFLFLQDHSSDCITVFFATVAGALSLALIVGVFVYYRQHENKHQLNVKEEPKLSGYGTNESKTLEEATNSFLLGPVKTPPPPEYVLEGYNWDPESTLSHKSVRNGSVSRHYNAKDVGSKNVGPREVNGHNRLSLEASDYYPSFDATIVRVQRPDGTIVSFKPYCNTNESPRKGGGGRYVNAEEYWKAKKIKEKESDEAFLY